METKSIYLQLTDEFNQGRLRTVICSGQAVVLHKLAIMSKDGDWILREDTEAAQHVLNVLSRRSATYRFGAPFDLRWLSGGWSAHFEFAHTFRVRTDFFTRPPRISSNSLGKIWREMEGRNPPFIDPPELAEMKKTNREKDFVVIGEIARLMKDPAEQLLYSRSARDLHSLAMRYPEMLAQLAGQRPLLLQLNDDPDDIARLLDEEKRQLIRVNEQRLEKYAKAGEKWKQEWPTVCKRVEGLSLLEAHHLIVEAAEKYLPFTPTE
ncbi:MAG: hypothetical protein SFY68_13915 [Candidatus Sumerlaeia bacterium]|nr:hypothetical protein [Candidatus Sumerlaeia bacterium]